MSDVGAISPTHDARPVGQARLIDTQSFVFWVFVVAVVYSGIHVFSEVTDSIVVQTLPAVGWSALVLWSIYAAAFLAIVYRHQLFVRRSPWVTVGALAWGGTVAYWFAVKANAAVGDLFKLWFSSDFNERWGTSLAAATNEETLKALGVIVIVLLPLTRVRSTLDGWFYGMMVGLGFQVVEDYVYTVNNTSSLAEVSSFFLQRGLLAGLWAHAVYTGIVGAGIGYLVTRNDRPLTRRIVIAVGLFALAWTFHFAWDLPVLNELFGSGFGGFIGIILLKGVPALVTLLLVVRWGRQHERKVWTAFVEASIDRTLLSEQEAADLLSRKARRAARKASAQAGGHRAKRLRKRLQLTQLRYVQAVQEEGAASADAAAFADLISRIRQDPAYS